MARVRAHRLVALAKHRTGKKQKQPLAFPHLPQDNSITAAMWGGGAAGEDAAGVTSHAPWQPQVQRGCRSWLLPASAAHPSPGKQQTQALPTARHSRVDVHCIRDLLVSHQKLWGRPCERAWGEGPVGQGAGGASAAGSVGWGALWGVHALQAQRSLQRRLPNCTCELHV